LQRACSFSPSRLSLLACSTSWRPTFRQGQWILDDPHTTGLFHGLVEPSASVLCTHAFCLLNVRLFRVRRSGDRERLVRGGSLACEESNNKQQCKHARRMYASVRLMRLVEEVHKRHWICIDASLDRPGTHCLRHVCRTSSGFGTPKRRTESYFWWTTASPPSRPRYALSLSLSLSLRLVVSRGRLVLFLMPAAPSRSQSRVCWSCRFPLGVARLACSVPRPRSPPKTNTKNFGLSLASLRVGLLCPSSVGLSNVFRSWCAWPDSSCVSELHRELLGLSSVSSSPARSWLPFFIFCSSGNREPKRKMKLVRVRNPRRT